MLEYYERRLCYEVLSIIQENAIYIGINAKDESSEEVFKCIGILETSSLENYSLLESSLEISLWYAKISILHDRRQESFILLFTFLFGKAKVILGIQLP